MTFAYLLIREGYFNLNTFYLGFVGPFQRDKKRRALLKSCVIKGKLRDYWTKMKIENMLRVEVIN